MRREPLEPLEALSLGPLDALMPHAIALNNFLEFSSKLLFLSVSLTTCNNYL